MARALIGKATGDSVEVSTPRGNKSYEIVTVGFGLTITARPIAAASNSVIPALGALSLVFGLWYAAAAWSLAPYPF